MQFQDDDDDESYRDEIDCENGVTTNVVVNVGEHETGLSLNSNHDVHFVDNYVSTYNFDALTCF